jgi:hypothetical protein
MHTSRLTIKLLLHFLFFGTFLIGCDGTNVVDVHFEGIVDHYSQDSKSRIQTVAIEDKIRGTAPLFPVMKTKIDSISMEINLSHFPYWHIHNQSDKPIRFRFDELSCVNRHNKTITAITLNGMMSGLIKKEDKSYDKFPQAIPIEIKAGENRWIRSYPKTDLRTLFELCTWRKEGESAKDIKQLSDLIGTEFALALPYESEGKTGQYVFRLKIKNVGSRVSYF